MVGPQHFTHMRFGLYSDSSMRFLYFIPLITWRSSTSANLDFKRQDKNRTAAITPTIFRIQTHGGISIFTPHSGGKISISTSPEGIPIHPSLAPSETISSSRPGVNGSGRLTFPDKRVTMQEPQLPLVQLVGISTLAA
jgi:hypothetical protein